MNVELLSPSFMSEVSLGKSSHHFMSSSPLRMINSLEFPSEKQNASFPSRMEVSAGKSVHQSPSDRITLKDCTEASKESATTNQK